MKTFIVLKNKENYIEIVSTRKGGWMREYQRFLDEGFKDIGKIQTNIVGKNVDYLIDDLLLREQYINKIKKLVKR